jgi:hypothetical protein
MGELKIENEGYPLGIYGGVGRAGRKEGDHFPAIILLNLILLCTDEKINLFFVSTK